jgi:hypothetical protein
MWHKINSADQAIDELGGTLKVATLFGVDERVVSNWRKRGLPPDTYTGLAPLLVQKSIMFSDALFGMRTLVNRRPPKRKRNGAR